MLRRALVTNVKGHEPSLTNCNLNSKCNYHHNFINLTRRRKTFKLGNQNRNTLHLQGSTSTSFGLPKPAKFDYLWLDNCEDNCEDNNLNATEWNSDWIWRAVDAITNLIDDSKSPLGHPRQDIAEHNNVCICSCWMLNIQSLPLSRIVPVSIFNEMKFPFLRQSISNSHLYHLTTLTESYCYCQRRIYLRSITCQNKSGTISTIETAENLAVNVNKPIVTKSTTTADPPGSSRSTIRIWDQDFEEDKIVSMDVEMVSIPKKDGELRNKFKAATISIVGWNGQIVYKGKVKHEPGTFIGDNRVVIFEEDSLMDGDDFQDVKTQVEKFLSDKLVITCSGEADFKSLDLSMENFNVFDLQSFWRRWDGSLQKNKEKRFNPIGLKKLCKFYCKRDIQMDRHDDEVDAQVTMELFRFHYVPLGIADRWFRVDDDRFRDI